MGEDGQVGGELAPEPARRQKKMILVYLYIESGILNQVIIKFNRRVLVVKKPFCNIDKPLKICDEPQGCLWQYLLL